MAAEETLRPFDDPAVEADYRQGRLAGDRRLAATLIGVGTAVAAQLVVVDLSAMASNPGLRWLLPVRGTLVAAGVLLAVLAARARQPRALDAISFTWSLALAALALGVGPTRPRTYTLNFAFEVLVVTANWALLPNTLPRQALAGLCHSAASLTVALRWRDVGGPVLPAILMALVSANLVGWFASTRLHLARRAEFLERRRLAEALAEVRTLRGLIPICAACKSIRTEQGEWRQLEEYLTAHTDAKLTHGICAACAERLYPDLERGEPPG